MDRVGRDPVWAHERRADGTIATTHSHASNRSRPRGLLAGMLACAECGGSAFVLDARGKVGCSWHRDRGPDVCASELLVARDELEARVLGVIRDEVLTPGNVAYATERALAIIRERTESDDTHEAEARHAELSPQIERLVKLAATAGDVEEIGEQLAQLRAERDALKETLSARALSLPDVEALRPEIEERVRGFGERMAGERDDARRALRHLLGDRRMTLAPDEERGFRVEGVFELDLGGRGRGDGRDGRPGHLSRVVAGTGFEPATFGL